MTGPELYEQRKRRGWTQQALAVKLGVHASTVHRWEIGQTTIPEKMAKLLRYTFG